MRKGILLYTLSFVFIVQLEFLVQTKVARSQAFDPLPPNPDSEISPSASENEIDAIRDRRDRLQAEFELLQTEYNLLLQQREVLRIKGPVLPPTTDATRPLPQSRTDLREGGKSSVESRILIYEAMDKVAKAIYKDISNVKRIKALVIYDQDAMSSITAHRLLKLKTKEFQARYNNLGVSLSRSRSRSRGVTDLTPIGLPAKFTRSALEFIALLRSEDQITFENDFRLNPNSVISAIASHIQDKDNNIRVYNPGLQLFASSSLNDPTLESIVGTDIARLIQLRSKASSFSSNDQLIRLNQEVDTFTEEIFRVQGSENIAKNPLLRAIIQANQLEKILTQDGAYILSLNTDVSGGSNRTRSSLFTSILTGSRLSFSGGVVINYSLFDRDGSLRKSNVFYYNTGYKGMGGKRTNIK